MGFKKIGVLFVDLDGTLADSMGMLFQVYLQFLAFYGCEGSRKEFEELIGPSVDQIIALLKERHQLQADAIELKRQYHLLFKRMYEGGVRPFWQAKESLAVFKKNLIRLYLVTSAEKELAELFLRQNDLEGFFEKVIAFEGDLPGKPDPAIYLKALKEARISNQEGIAIEDSNNGIRAALSAGLEVIQFNPEGKPSDHFYIRKFSTWPEIKNYLIEKHEILSNN